MSDYFTEIRSKYVIKQITKNYFPVYLEFRIDYLCLNMFFY